MGESERESEDERHVGEGDKGRAIDRAYRDLSRRKTRFRTSGGSINSKGRRTWCKLSLYLDLAKAAGV